MRNALFFVIGLAGAIAGWYFWAGGREQVQHALPDTPTLGARGPEVIHDRDGRAFYRVRGDDLEQRAIEACFELDNRELKIVTETGEGLKFCCRVRGRAECDHPEQPNQPKPVEVPPGPATIVGADGRPLAAEAALQALDARTASVHFGPGTRVSGIDPQGKPGAIDADAYTRAMAEGWAMQVGDLYCRLKSAPRPVARTIRRSTERFECW